MNKILFLTLHNFENPSERGIFTDLVRSISEEGNEVYVVTVRERRSGLPTELVSYGNITVLKIRSLNIQKCSMIEKGLSTLMLTGLFLRSIRRYLKDVKFDMVIYSTPPITFAKVVGSLKKEHGAVSYLMLKDIFPQNAVDIGIFRPGSAVYRYFRKKEKELYSVSDHIGCMSEANRKFILQHNPETDPSKIEIFPNSVIPIQQKPQNTEKTVFLRRFGVPEGSVLFIYGGNIGKPQGVDFIIEIVRNFHRIKNGFLLIVGSGTEYGRLRQVFDSEKPANSGLYRLLPKDDYDSLLQFADVGLVFLDRRFTIPNFPSRLLSYMENSLPVIAATDSNTDLGQMLGSSGSGLWSESGDTESFISNAAALAEDSALRGEMGKNSREYLENNYDVRKYIELLTGKL